MAVAVEILDFVPGDLDELVAQMDAIGAKRDGWINLMPYPPEDARGAQGLARGAEGQAQGADGQAGRTPAGPDHEGDDGGIDQDALSEDQGERTGQAGLFNLFTRWRTLHIEGTWIPGNEGRHGAEPDSVGLIHPAGRFAARQLADAGHPVPEGWKIVADHLKRGLVLSVPPASDAHASHRLIAAWVTMAGATLAPQQMSGRWRADLHRRR